MAKKKKWRNTIFGHNWYWGLTKRYVAYFGTIFNDVYITRTISGSSDPSQFVKVPLSYAPKKKIIDRVDQDPEIQALSAIDLPRMSFEITSMQYDQERNLGQLQRYVVKHPTDPNQFKYIYVDAPYNINFALYIYTKNTEDMMKIVEQIYPFFKPEWTSSVQLVPEFGITKDIPIELVGGPTIEDGYEGNLKDKQLLIYTFNFNMKAFFFGPKYEKKVIKYVYENFYMATTSNNEVTADEGDLAGYIKVSPGLDANGAPTSNVSITIDRDEIWVDDDFGFCVERVGVLEISND